MRGAKIPKKGEQEMKGVITEIERFSLKDGPGIRTTVFFKGCNMACKWCHNPETLAVKPQLMVYPKTVLAAVLCKGVQGGSQNHRKRYPALRPIRMYRLRRLRAKLLHRGLGDVWKRDGCGGGHV